MSKKFKEKYNEGCIKIFRLLKLLYEDEADYESVMAIFANSEDDKDRQCVTLNKFLNTLKVFGTKVIKENNRYKVQNVPFSLKFDMDDLKSINLLKKVYEYLPESKNKAGLSDFIKNIESKFDNDTKLKLYEISSNDNSDYSFYYSDLSKQIAECEKFCQNDYKLNIRFLYKNKEVKAFCNAKQLVYDNKNAYLRVYKILEKEIQDILITNIISIEQTPSLKSDIEGTKTLIFKLKGRLAKAYIPKEGEYVQEYFSDGSIIVINKNEPVDALLRRLMKYDYECTILHPLDLRKRMKELINDTLKNYE